MARRNGHVHVLKQQIQQTNYPLQKADDFTRYIFQKTFFLITSSEESNSGCN